MLRNRELFSVRECHVSCQLCWREMYTVIIYALDYVCRWSVVPIPGAARPLEALQAASPEEPRTPLRSSEQRHRRCGSHAVLFCRVCGAKHGLWAFLGGAPAMSTRAAVLAATPAPLRTAAKRRFVPASFSTPRSKVC